MRPRRVEVSGPPCEDPAQVPLAERDHVVQAFAPERADHALANGIRPGGSHWGLENFQAQPPDGLVELARELGVSVADQESVRMIRRNGFPELQKCQSAAGCRVTLK